MDDAKKEYGPQCIFCGNKRSSNLGRYFRYINRWQCDICNYTFRAEKTNKIFIYWFKEITTHGLRNSSGNYDEARKATELRYSAQELKESLDKALRFAKKMKTVHKSKPSDTDKTTNASDTPKEALESYIKNT